jgi:hypothetical protein
MYEKSLCISLSPKGELSLLRKDNVPCISTGGIKGRIKGISQQENLTSKSTSSTNIGAKTPIASCHPKNSEGLRIPKPQNSFRRPQPKILLI